MGLNELILKVTDPYERQARLWPALLALLPLIVMLWLEYGPKVSALSNVGTLVASCGGLYFLSNVSREYGKRLEIKLFDSWGGKPTTQLLRHRDTTIEAVTKVRYHAFLSANIKVPFPDKEQELSNPRAADDIYQSSVRWLLNKTSDIKQFSLLFKENTTYGFRRNALGLKSVGVAASLSSLIWVLVVQGIINGQSKNFINAAGLRALPETAVISLATSALMFFVWVFIFTKASVRTAAFTYAETLLRTCDALNKE